MSNCWKSHAAAELWWPTCIQKLNFVCFQPNQAGLVYQKLFKEEWRTVETIDIMDEEEICLQGFKGDYSVKLMENGQLIHSENVVLTSDGLTVDMSK